MLDTIFRNNGERKQAEVELRDLLAEVREERATMRAQLDQASAMASRLSRANKVLDEVGAKADAAMKKVELLAEVASGHEERARRLEKLDVRMGELLAQVAEAERASKALLEPDGALHRHRKALDDLGVRARDAEVSLASVRHECQELARTQTQLRQSGQELQLTAAGLAALRGELAELGAAEESLRQEVHGSREVARQARADSDAASGTVRELETRLESLVQLQDLSKDTDKRIASLHMLAEHVSLKAQSLETQRHAVEHAVAETGHLHQTVSAMEAQVAKLAEGRDQIQRAEEAVARVGQLARSATQELAQASSAREAFAREAARWESQGRSLLDAMRAAAERLAVDKEEFGAFDERMKSLAAALAETEGRVQDVLAKDEALLAMEKRAAGLGKIFGELRAETEELARRQSALDALTEQLGLVEALGRRTAAQQDNLLKAQGDLQAMRGQLEQLQQAFGEASRTRASLAEDRSALEAFAERMGALIGRTPEIEDRLAALLGKMTALEEGNRAVRQLADDTAELGAAVERVGARMKLVERVDERVSSLLSTTTEVERKLAEQTASRAEMDALAQVCESLTSQIGLARQQLDDVAAQQGRLLPLAAEVKRLEGMLGDSQRALAAMKKDEAAAAEQHSRLAERIEHGLRQAADTALRLQEVQALGGELAQVSGLGHQVMEQLAQVQSRQRETLAQVSLTEDQLQRAEAMSRQLEQRRTLLAHSEKSLASVESRLADLDRHAEGLDRKIRSLAEREALVQAVKAEVDGIRQISGRSKADLQFVAEHRGEVADLRGKVDDLLARLGDTDDKIVLIESWRKKVEEVQVSAHSMTSLLGDMQGTIESLSEQRVVIEDVGEKLARLEFTVQEAQGMLSRLDGSAQEAHITLRTLQRERDVADKVEKSLRLLRGRSASPPAAAA
jgi:chromosome segregation ATPase